MQILLGAQGTVVKVQGSRNKIQHILNFIETQFSNKLVTQECIEIYFCTQERLERVFLMKWLYSLYFKQHNNVPVDLRSALISRIEKPIVIHLPPIVRVTISIIVTFYEGGICHLGIDQFNKTCDKFLMQYFSGYITLKSKTFNLYELSLYRLEDKQTLAHFLTKVKIHGVNVNLKYNTQARDRFLEITPKMKAIDKAYLTLKVNKTDSFNKIKLKYKKLAKVYHPDLCEVKSKQNIKKNTEHFQTLLEAFSLIKKEMSVA